jgi:hypothetical protein
MQVISSFIRITYVPTKHTVPAVQQSVRAHCRALEHMEALVMSRIKAAKPGELVAFPSFESDVAYIFGTETPAIQTLLLQAIEADADVYARLLPLTAQYGNLAAETSYASRAAIAGRRFENPKDPEAGVFARFAKLLIPLRELPGAKERFRAHLLGNNSIGVRTTDFVSYFKMLDTIAEGANEDVRAVVAEARKKAEARVPLARDKATQDLIKYAWIRTDGIARFTLVLGTMHASGCQVTVGRPTVANPLDTARDVFTRVTLTSPGSKPDAGLRWIQGIIPSGPGVDVLWSGATRGGSGMYGRAANGTLYVMKEKGTARPVHQFTGKYVEFRGVVFDGQFVWGGVGSENNPPVLFVLDPKTEKVHVFGDKDGIPVGKAPTAPSDRLSPPQAAPLAPGRVCVAGSTGRGWIALVTFDPQAGSTVKIIHEAKDAGKMNDPDLWKSTKVGFQPRFVCTLPGPDGKPARVLVFRGGTIALNSATNLTLGAHPLLVDPEKGTVEAVAEGAPTYRQHTVKTNHAALVFTRIARTDDRFVVSGGVRIDHTGVTRFPPQGEELPLTTASLFDGRNLHVVRYAPALTPTLKDRIKFEPTWWVFDADGKNGYVAAKDFPTVTALGFSSHYGPVALVEQKDKSNFRETAFCTVGIELPPRK